MVSKIIANVSLFMLRNQMQGLFFRVVELETGKQHRESRILPDRPPDLVPRDVKFKYIQAYGFAGGPQS